VDVGAVSRQNLSKASTETARRAGDKGDLAVEIHLHDTPRCDERCPAPGTGQHVQHQELHSIAR
jgi:hypothetical protein